MYVSFLFLAVLTSFSSAFASDLNWDFTFSPSDIVLSPSGEYTVVTLADGANTRDAIGTPSIPAKFVNILLPDGATNVSVSATGSLELLASDVMPWPVQRVAPKSKVQPPFTAPDAAAYASANPWPAAAATFEGIHEMQGSTFVSVRVNPIVYVGSEKALYYRPRVTVSVTYTLGARSKVQGARGLHNSRVGRMVNALVVNPSASSALPRSSKRSDTTVDYLIITSSSLSSAFQNLADYRASAIGGGYSTLVVTKEDISSSYTGNDVQMKIRNCIIDYVTNHGTTYVVLGGDDTVIPDRDTYANVDGETIEKHMPTDLYYSDLTGTWKSSGNANYGVTAAKVDMSPDVIVGRIPIRNASQLNNYLRKVRTFEADLSHTRNSIIMGGPAAWCRYYGSKRPSDDVTGDGHSGFRVNHTYVSDSEMWLRRLYRDGIKPYWDNAESTTDRTVSLACDAITSWDASKCGDKVLSATNLKTWLNKGYTHLMFSGHGFPQGWGMESGSEYSTTQASAQTGLVAFVYTDACLTGAFDEDGVKSYGITVDAGTSEEYTYTSEPCLGEAFIRNANGGALVHMGCARYGWGEPDYLDSDPEDTDYDGYYTKCTASNTSDGGPSTVYAYKFYKRLYEADAVAENRTLGEAFALSKADMISQCGSYGCERWIQFGLNFLGDPAIALYPRTSLVAPKDLAASEVTTTSFKVSWTASEGADSYQVDVVKGTSFEADEYVAGWQGTTVDGTSANITGLMQNTAYSVRVRAVNSDDTSNWSDILSVTTAVGEVAPEWSAFPAETCNIYVSAALELNIGDYVSGFPIPTLSMVSSETEEATFDPSNGAFLFTPSSVGTYQFVFRAENTQGSAEATLTVNVTIPPVTVPTLAFDEAGITSTIVPVSWTACDDVTAYTLQLATDDAFTSGNQSTPVTLVENSATNSTAPSGWTYNISSNSKSYLILFSGSYVITEAFDASACSSLELSLSMRTYGGITDASNKLLIEYSSDMSNWKELATVSASNNIMTKKTLNVSPAAGLSPVYFRFSVPGASSSKGVGIKDILISGTKTVGGSVVSTTIVNDTVYTFTELDPGKVYFARVKGEADWSNIISFTTNNVLILSGEADNSEAVSNAAANGGRYDVTLQDCVFYKDDNWNTICLPFDLTIKGSAFDGADVRTLGNASFEDGTLTLNFTAERTVKTILAGIPYIIKWPYGSNITNPVFKNVMIDDSKKDFISTDGKLRFAGTYAQIPFEKEDRSIFYMKGDNILFYPTAGAKIGALRCFFQLPDGSMVNQFVLNIDEVDNPTYIKRNDEELWTTDNEVYNLAGQKMMNRPSAFDKRLFPKGIYIQNGKKVVK